MMSVRTAIIVLQLILLIFMTAGCQSERKGGPLMEGDGAPDFMAKDLSGDVFILSSKPSYPVILRFFETNCAFCRADTPAINQFYQEYRDKGLRVLYVGAFFESRQRVDKYVEGLGITFPVVLDQDARLADLYNIKIYPQTFFIGPDQEILANLFGGVDESLLEKLLGKYLH